MTTTLDQYRGTQIEKCYVSTGKKDFIDPKKVFNTLNSNLEKSLISEELHEKAMNQLDNLIEKAQGKKYIKRTGTPGNYKYYYTEEEYKRVKRGNEKDYKSIGVKHFVKKMSSEDLEEFIKENPNSEFLQAAKEELGSRTKPRSSEDDQRINLIDKKTDSELEERGEKKISTFEEVLSDPEGKEIVEGIEGLDSKRQDHKPLYHDYVKQLKDKFNYDYKDSDWDGVKKSFEDNISILKGEQLEGGLGDNLSVEDIAKKHKVSKETIENQLEIGIKVEMEHTNNKSKAKEIVLDHLTEAPDYYTKLGKMERELNKAESVKKSFDENIEILKSK